MLILLPLLAFAALFLVLLGRDESRAEERPWQGSFLLGSGLWGAALVVMTEALSLFTAIGRPGVVAGWTVMLLGAFAWGRSRNYLSPGWRRLRSMALSLNEFELALLGVIGMMALVLLAVVFAAPVNTVDVLQYHMPRVLQWAQNESLDHFPAPHLSQNKRPYWAEGVMLHLRLLWGDDTPVELVNWLSWLALAAPASGIAQLLGEDRIQPWLAAVFAWTIPTAVLHATSAMVDLPAAFWAAAMGYFVIAFLQGQTSRSEVIGIGLGLGLGMLTKGTFFPFAAALLILWASMLLGRGEWRSLALNGSAVALIVVMLNGLFWSRNVATFGGPYGSSVPVQGSGTLVGDPDRDEEALQVEHSTGVAGAFTARGHKLVRMGLLHFVTPVGGVNQKLFAFMGRHPGLFPNSYLEPLRIAAWNNVMTGGSPVHWLLSFVAVGIVGLRSIRIDRGGLKSALAFGVALLIGYLLLSLVTFASSVFGVRYQLPFLVLAAPLVGLSYPERLRALIPLAVVGLVLYAWPYALLNHTRPAISRTPWPTKTSSVFTANDEEILFSLSPEIQDEYALIARTVRDRGCRDVGFMTDSKDLEYTLWWLLMAPQSGIDMQHYSFPHSLASLGDPNFEACAVICTVCARGETEQGLPLALDGGHIRLYMVKE